MIVVNEMKEIEGRALRAFVGWICFPIIQLFLSILVASIMFHPVPLYTNLLTIWLLIPAFMNYFRTIRIIFKDDQLIIIERGKKDQVVKYSKINEFGTISDKHQRIFAKNLKMKKIGFFKKILSFNYCWFGVYITHNNETIFLSRA